MQHITQTHQLYHLARLLFSLLFDISTMGKKKQASNGDQETKHVGRQNAFSGAKLAWLVSRKDEYLNSTNHGDFYEYTARLFIAEFGYDLKFEVNPPEGTDSVSLAPRDIDPMLPPDEYEAETIRRRDYFDVLRAVSSCRSWPNDADNLTEVR